ncbi:hypothetical protein QL093DRAFT_2461992 [Fusarium oxysporum]|nr:hypothetical protein QL093DRAFT_2461992 [Fusarium oxysporum]
MPRYILTSKSTGGDEKDYLVAITDIICYVEKDQNEIYNNLKKFEDRPAHSQAEFCFYHKLSRGYLWFNKEADIIRT